MYKHILLLSFPYDASKGQGRWLARQAWGPGLDSQEEHMETSQTWCSALVVDQRGHRRLPGACWWACSSQWETTSQIQGCLQVPYIHTHVLNHTGAPPQEHAHLCTYEHTHTQIHTASHCLFSPMLCLLSVPGLSHSCLLAEIQLSVRFLARKSQGSISVFSKDYFPVKFGVCRISVLQAPSKVLGRHWRAVNLAPSS